MTPLAMQIWEQKRLPIAQRTFNDKLGLLPLLDNFHCFDVTECLELIQSMATEMLMAADFDKSLAFLPAEKTWIEWVAPADNFRVGFLLHRPSLDASKARVIPARFTHSAMGFVLPLDENAVRVHAEKRREIEGWADLIDASNGRFTPAQMTDVELSGWTLLAALALINGPGLCPQRKLHHSRPVAKRLGLRVNGSFPLLAWTELTLRVGEGEQKSWTGGRQGGRTDMMPLHFVRAHRRRINGEWRKIEAFWRGNAALGIKQTRYKVKPRGSSNGS